MCLLTWAGLQILASACVDQRSVQATCAMRPLLAALKVVVPSSESSMPLPAAPLPRLDTPLREQHRC